jgi:YVTN family beta-propeller protein
MSSRFASLPTLGLIAATTVFAQSHPPIVYVTTNDGGVSEVNATNNSVIATAPFRGTGAATAVTPDGRRFYVTDYLSANVTVFEAATNVPVAQVPVGSGTGNIGVSVTPDGSAVYVTSQFDGTVSVIATATNTVVKTIPVGTEPVWVMISPDGSRAYVSNQASGTVSVIATASNQVIATINGIACPYGTRLTRYASELLVADQCGNSLKVVNTASNTVMRSIPTGSTPRGVAVTPDGERAYVTDFGGNTVEVIDLNSLTNLGTPIIVGANPRGLAIVPGGQLYVANFGDTTVSVIDTKANQVTATLRVRPGAAEVTVSTTARPLILKYSFIRFDVPGATDTFARGINNRGQNVGSFVDAGGVEHGYLRQRDGSFVTLDPPGSVGTVAAGINDLGTIVGTWFDNAGASHGFTRSQRATYTTLDFPGATDTGLNSIDDAGRIVGAYDLGDQTTSIGFVYVSGQFNSFEDPTAVPAQTAPAGINLLGFISGVYVGTDGSNHGFVRDPTGQFEDYDFPRAGFTSGTRINAKGQVIGNYSLQSIGHGFILSGAMSLTGPPSPAQFFSFDYPDSRVTAGRGINDLGQIAGWFFLPGDPIRHGFLATPRSE